MWVVLRETHHATLVRRSRIASDNERLTRNSRKENILITARRNWKAQDFPRTLRRSIALPVKVSGHLPVFMILILIGIFNGLVNMILSSLGSVFQFQYGFPPTTAGLAYLGLGIGGILGLAATPRLSDLFGKIHPHPDGSKRPQYALPSMIVAGPLTAIGLLLYGWSCQARTFWFVPIFALSIYGFGYTSMTVCFQARDKSSNYTNILAVVHPDVPCRSRTELHGICFGRAHHLQLYRWCAYSNWYLSTL